MSLNPHVIIPTPTIAANLYQEILTGCSEERVWVAFRRYPMSNLEQIPKQAIGGRATALQRTYYPTAQILILSASRQGYGIDLKLD